MESLRRLLRLSLSEHWLLIKMLFLLGAIRLGLTLLPFQTMQCLLARFSEPLAEPISHHAPQAGYVADRESIVWATSVVGKRILGDAPCLTQALAVRLLFRRRGHPAHLHIGVVKDSTGRLRAHAWIESDGEVVIGGPESELERYTPLPGVDDYRLGEVCR